MAASKILLIHLCLAVGFMESSAFIYIRRPFSDKLTALAQLIHPSTTTLPPRPVEPITIFTIPSYVATAAVNPVDINTDTGFMEETDVNDYDEEVAGDKNSSSGDNNLNPVGNNAAPINSTSMAGSNSSLVVNNSGAGPSNATPVGNGASMAGNNPSPVVNNAGAGPSNATPVGNGASMAGSNPSPVVNNAGAGPSNATPVSNSASMAGSNPSPVVNNGSVFRIASGTNGIRKTLKPLIIYYDDEGEDTFDDELDNLEPSNLEYEPANYVISLQPNQPDNRPQLIRGHQNKLKKQQTKRGNKQRSRSGCRNGASTRHQQQDFRQTVEIKRRRNQRKRIEEFVRQLYANNQEQIQ